MSFLLHTVFSPKRSEKFRINSMNVLNYFIMFHRRLSVHNNVTKGPWDAE